MFRIGIDLGGTKIELVALDDNGNERVRRRVATPQGDYAATLDTRLVPSLHGDASGVRSAAWLWPQSKEHCTS